MRKTKGRLIAPVALLVCVGVVGATPPGKPEKLVPREFFRPDLVLKASTAPVEELGIPLADLRGLQQLHEVYDKNKQPHVRIDRRSGRPSTVIGAIALVPGRGVGNEMTFDEVSMTLGRPVGSVGADVIRQAALRFLEGALDIDPSEFGRMKTVPLGDLWFVEIRRQYQGVPVEHSRITLYVKYGNVLSFGTEFWGDIALDPGPHITAHQAVAVGLARMGVRGGDRNVSDPTLSIHPAVRGEGTPYDGQIGKGYTHRLAWSFDVHLPGETENWTVLVDAHTGEALAVADTNQHAAQPYHITGTVYPGSSTGQCPVDAEGLLDPDRCGTAQPGTPFVGADTGAANIFTDLGGGHSLDPVTVTLDGEFASVTDLCGAIHESSGSGGSGGGPGGSTQTPNLNLGGANDDHDCTAAGSAGNTAAARTAFHEVNRLRNIIESWIPCGDPDNPLPCFGFLKLGVPVVTNDSSIEGCNAAALKEDLSIHFPTAANQDCHSVGELRGLVAHEYGHIFDFDDGSEPPLVTGPSFSEGVADLMAALTLQNSCVGYGLHLTDKGCGQNSDGTYNGDMLRDSTEQHCMTGCSGVRDIDWRKHSPAVPDTRNFVCNSCSGGPGPCGRQVHCGSALMSQAVWDLAASDLQNAPAYLDENTAFVLVLRWFILANQSIEAWHDCSCPNVSGGCGNSHGYNVFLAFDDDNGNLSDGTPHMEAIYAAFNRHQIACNDLPVRNDGCEDTPSLSDIEFETIGVSGYTDGEYIKIDWQNPGLEKFVLLRSEGPFGCEIGKAVRHTAIPPWDDSEFIDDEVLQGHQYCYSLIAEKTGGGAQPESCLTRATPCVCTTPPACTSPGQSPVVLLEEDFVNGIPATWAVVDGGSGSATWALSTVQGGPGMTLPEDFPWMEVRSDEAPLELMNESLVTHEIQRNGCRQIELEFDEEFVWVADNTHEVVDVDTSTDGGFTWRNVRRLENAGREPASHRLDLTPYVVDDPSFRIRFHYYDAVDDGSWSLDNVSVTCNCS